jgi:uncharacterized protein involved in outer membrane biogenesis
LTALGAPATVRLMRKVLIALGVVVGTTVALLAVALLSLNRVVAANRGAILERVQAAVGRPVRAEHITISLWGGLGVQLQRVAIAEDPRFGSGDFLRASTVTGRTDLLPLLRGTLRVSRIDLEEPVCEIIRNAAGEWNYASLRPLAGDDSAPATHKPRRASSTLAALIARAAVQDGTLLFTDERATAVHTRRATQIDLIVTEVGATTAMHFSLDAAVDSPAPNVHLTGSVGPLVDLAAIPLTVDGAVGPIGAQDASLDALHVAAVVTPTTVRATAFDGRAFGGTFTAKGEFPTGADVEEASAVTWLSGSASGVDVRALMRVLLPKAGIRITGTAHATADLRSSGTTTDAFERNLRGTVEAEVHNGRVEDFNIVKDVLGKVTGLPGINTLVSATVKPKYGRLFSESETHLETLHATFHVADRRVQTDDLTIVAADYGVRAAGWVTFDQQADIVGTLMMSQRFSRDVATDVKEVRRILDQNGQLVVPFRLRGKLGTATPEPQLGGLLRAMTEGATSDVIGTLLREEDRATGGAIERGLRSLFGR